MAFTNQDIIAAYNQRGNASEAEFASWANSQGVSNDQLLSARSELIGAPAPAPAPSQPKYDQNTLNILYEEERRRGADDAGILAASNQYGITADQFGAARDVYTGKQQQAISWANGKTLDEILGKSAELGLHANEMGSAFGAHGGSGAQVTAFTGYDGNTWNKDATNGWTYNLADQAGWIKAPIPAPAPAPVPPTNQWIPDAPGVGINLSQIQAPTNWDVTPNQTVAHQLEQIISADSPLMQQARMRAMQSANASGLLNSTMAASAGESALYDAAMPIAQQDAGTYADSGRFNADASNTFRRDNNAFVRDAYMADFNLAANEWAKQQDQMRSFEAMDYESKLTLDRDAILNGYQSARDAIQNGYTIDADNRKFEWQSGESALDRAADVDKLTWQSGENVLDRDNAITRASMSAPAPDTSLQRTAMTIAAEQEMAAISQKNAAQETLTNARAQFNKDVLTININDLSKEKADNAYAALATNYNAIVDNVATNYGLDSADSWKVEVPVAAPAAAAAPVAPAANEY